MHKYIAMICTALLVSACAAAQPRMINANAVRLNAAQLTHAVSGHTFKGTYLDNSSLSWKPFEETYKPDGSIDGLNHGTTYNGKWVIKANELCLAFRDHNDGCGQLYFDKTSGLYQFVQNGAVVSESHQIR